MEGRRSAIPKTGFNKAPTVQRPPAGPLLSSVQCPRLCPAIPRKSRPPPVRSACRDPAQKRRPAYRLHRTRTPPPRRGSVEPTVDLRLGAAQRAPLVGIGAADLNWSIRMATLTRISHTTYDLAALVPKSFRHFPPAGNLPPAADPLPPPAAHSSPAPRGRSVCRGICGLCAVCFVSGVTPPARRPLDPAPERRWQTPPEQGRPMPSQS